MCYYCCCTVVTPVYGWRWWQMSVVVVLAKGCCLYLFRGTACCVWGVLMFMRVSLFDKAIRVLRRNVFCSLCIVCTLLLDAWSGCNAHVDLTLGAWRSAAVHGSHRYCQQSYWLLLRGACIARNLKQVMLLCTFQPATTTTILYSSVVHTIPLLLYDTCTSPGSRHRHQEAKKAYGSSRDV